MKVKHDLSLTVFATPLAASIGLVILIRPKIRWWLQHCNKGRLYGSVKMMFQTGHDHCNPWTKHRVFSSQFGPAGCRKKYASLTARSVECNLRKGNGRVVHLNFEAIWPSHCIRTAGYSGIGIWSSWNRTKSEPYGRPGLELLLISGLLPKVYTSCFLSEGGEKDKGL